MVLGRYLPSVVPNIRLGAPMLIYLFILFPSLESQMVDKEAELQKLFNLRNENEWKSVWHSESHVRCRNQLLSHMDWACQKDIYRIEKKPKMAVTVDPLQAKLGSVFLNRVVANSIIKPWTGYIRRKRETKSITDECCSDAGCTWEEYAEYCPAHRRYRVTRSRS